MSSASSALALALAAALDKGPLSGPSGVSTPTAVHILAEKANVPVGAPSVVAATDYIRFGMVPKGARIIRPGSLLSTDHTATVAGKLVFVPVSGVGGNQEITGVTANLEATETTSIPDAADDLTIAVDSWVQFVPTADLTIAATPKNFWLRLLHALPY